MNKYAILLTAFIFTCVGYGIGKTGQTYEQVGSTFIGWEIPLGMLAFFIPAIIGYLTAKDY